MSRKGKERNGKKDGERGYYVEKKAVWICVGYHKGIKQRSEK